MLNVVGNGECIGDTMWASIWRWKAENVGQIHAGIMDLSLDNGLLNDTNLCLVSSHVRAPWRDDSDI